MSYFLYNPRPFFEFAKEIWPGLFHPSPCHRFIHMVEKQGKLLRHVPAPVPPKPSGCSDPAILPLVDLLSDSHQLRPQELHPEH